MAFRSNGPMTVALPAFRGVTRQILLTAIGVYFAFLLLGLFSQETAGTLQALLSLVPELAAHRLIWQFLTYPFINAGLFGFLFACLSVWFFGAALEEELGARWMREFFLACTLGGSVLATIFCLTAGPHIEGLNPAQLTNGLWPFSLALLLVYARLHPDQELNFNFILRVKAKYIAMIYLLVYLAVMLSAHQRLDALLVITNGLAGWMFLRFAPRRGIGFAAAESWFGLRNSWYRTKRRRAAKKFTVYMQKQGRDVQFDESGRYMDPDAERRDPKDRKWMN